MLPKAFEEEMRGLLGRGYENYLAAMEQPAVRGLHFNRRKGDPAAAEAAVREALSGLSDLSYADDGCLWQGEERIGRMPLHHAGAFYMQEPSAMAPVCCLPDISGCRVLDLCAAPGGKSTQLANRIGPDGLLVSNEIVGSRCAVLCGNIERMGLRCAAVTKAAPEQLAEVCRGFFDVTVVDAPCSGEGMFRKDPAAVAEWKPESPAACARRQAAILDAAAETLRPGGYLLYATCTFSVCENEGTIAAFLKAHPDFTLCEVPQAVAAVTAPGVQPPQGGLAHPEYCRRFYPHLAAGEGQFMALLRRSENAEGVPDGSGAPSFPSSRTADDLGRLSLPDAPRGAMSRADVSRPLGASARGVSAADRIDRRGKGGKRDGTDGKAAEAACVSAFLQTVLEPAFAASLPAPVPVGGGWSLPPLSPAALPAEILPLCYAYGVRIGEVRKGRVIPHHHFFTAYGDKMKAKWPLDGQNPLLSAYFAGEELPCDLPDGWAAVTLCDLAVGGVRIAGGRAKNLYPAGLRGEVDL